MGSYLDITKKNNKKTNSAAPAKRQKLEKCAKQQIYREQRQKLNEVFISDLYKSSNPY